MKRNRWLKFTVPPARRDLRNASLRKKVAAKRWLRLVAGLVQKECDGQLCNLVAFGTTHPEMKR